HPPSYLSHLLLLPILPPPRPTLFPYTTLFRSFPGYAARPLIMWVLGYQVGIVDHFRLRQGKQQMFLLQGLVRTQVDMSDKIVKSSRRTVEHLAKAHHIEPGDLFVAEFVPTFPPNGFPKAGLARVGKVRGGQPRPTPDLGQGIDSILGGSVH